MLDEWVPYGERQPLGGSALWDISSQYYRDKGLEAWLEIPYVITGSRVLAEVYADLILALCKDVGPRWQGKTLHILELGAGLGRLGFHLARLLEDKFSRFAATRDLQWKLTLSDMTAEVVDFWRSHPGFQPLIQAGRVDFAVHPELPVAEPLVVVANYFFDSLPHDEFLLDEHRLQECHVQLMRRPGSPGDVPHIKDVGCEKSYEPVNTYHHYPHLAWNRILRDYRAEASRGAFLFPRTALEILGTWSGKEFALLSSDRGFTTLQSMVSYPEHPYTVHAGAFSHMVNYDAIARWFRNAGGLAWLTNNGVFNALQTACCLSPALGSGPFEELDYVFEQRLNRQNVVNSTHNLFSMVRADEPTMPQAYRAFLRLSGCDPDALVLCAKSLGESVGTLTPTEYADLGNLLDQVASHVYLHPGVTRGPFWLAHVYMQMGRIPEARKFLQMTIDHFGSDEVLEDLMRHLSRLE